MGQRWSCFWSCSKVTLWLARSDHCCWDIERVVTLSLNPNGFVSMSRWRTAYFSFKKFLDRAHQWNNEFQRCEVAVGLPKAQNHNISSWPYIIFNWFYKSTRDFDYTKLSWFLSHEIFCDCRFTFFCTKRWPLLWKSTACPANESFLAFMRMWGYFDILITFLVVSTYGMRLLGTINRILRLSRHCSCGLAISDISIWLFRSHHEKIVIVDNHICFIGGLDLCFGRYDTSKHNVGDHPPLIWPGKDYYNPR